MKPPVPVQAAYTYRYDHPPSVSREVGRIIVRWAFLEHYLQKLIWIMLGVSDPLGRLAVRETRITDRIDLIVDVAKLKKIPIDEARWTKIKTVANNMSSKRDLMAHGIWVKNPENDTWMVQLSRGNWPKDINIEHRNRRIAPEGLNADLKSLRNLTGVIELLIQAAMEESEKMGPHLPWRQTPLEQSELDRRDPDLVQAMRPRPPKPSPA